MLQGEPMKATIRSRLRYRFENFLAKGGRAIFLSLLVLFVISFLLVIAVKALVLLVSKGNAQESLQNLWLIFNQLIDPGNVADTRDLDMRLVGTIATMLGVVIFSMLIAFITTQLETLIYTFRKGRSQVLEQDHTLILGWNARTIDIILELIIANESEKRASVVVLAACDKEAMDDELHKQIPDSKTTRIITRSGDPASLTELRRVNAGEARAAIVLASCSDNGTKDQKDASDTQSIKTLMALIACQGDDSDVTLIAEIFSADKRQMINHFQMERIISIDSLDILGRILVQTSLTSGLEMVYNEMLSFDGCEVYFYTAAWNGLPFANLVYHFQDGIPLGIRRKDGTLLMRPPEGTNMEAGDSILILAEDDSTVRFRKNRLFTPAALPYTAVRAEQNLKRILLLGWHEIGNILIREYADYLREGSLIDVMLRNPSQETLNRLNRLKEAHQSLRINVHVADPFVLENLDRLEPFSYHNVIILAQNEEEQSPEKVDSDTLMILLLLRKIGREKGNNDRSTRIITQVLNSENQELITQTDVDDFIISNKLITMILAQLSEQPAIKMLYDDLFQEEGSEIYVKPARLYFQEFPVKARFADLIAQAAKREEICLGVRFAVQARDPKNNFGVQLNPAKDKPFTLSKDDYLVVLAEDEL